MKLSEAEIQQQLTGIEGWIFSEQKWISRKFRFDTFTKAITFVNKVAEIAEANQHHPFISIDYKVVTLRMTSWHAGGLTRLDFESAAQFNQAYD